jgi:hypothetical protein
MRCREKEREEGEKPIGSCPSWLADGWIHYIGLRPMFARLGGRPTDRTAVACIGSKRNQGENVPPTLALFAQKCLTLREAPGVLIAICPLTEWPRGNWLGGGRAKSAYRLT